MTTSEQLYQTISDIIQTYSAQNHGCEPESTVCIQSRREEHHFGIQPIRDQSGSISDILQSPTATASVFIFKPLPSPIPIRQTFI